MKISAKILLLILIISLNIYSQYFWERTSGLDSIEIYSLAINSYGDIFVGTDSGYYDYRSTDDGNTWTNVGLMNLETTGIVIKPSGEILIITLDHLMGGGVFRSTDNGNNWLPTSFISAGSSIAINSNGHIFVGTLSSGVFRSTDNAENWVQINQGLSDPFPTSLLINSSDDIFVGTLNQGVFRSTDNGESWIQRNQGITNNSNDYHILSLGINASGDVFAGTSGGGVYKSTNNGESWVQINQGLTSEGRYVLSLKVTLNGDIFAGTFDGAYRSTNNGNEWIQVNQGLTIFPRILSLAINSNGDIFAGTLDGVFRAIPSANIKVFLQGPYASGSMNTTLRDNGYVPLAQPYNAAPWNYTGTEAVATVPAGVVDWVLLDLRSNITTQVSRRAAFLMSDGSVVDLDGVSKVKFPGVTPGDYFVVIRHRNHLAVMSANPVTLSYSPVLYDFTTGSDQFYGGSVGSVQLSTSPIRWGMLGGDGNSSGIVTNSDKDAIINNLNNAGYYNGDTNFSGIVTNSDKDLIINNLNKSSSLP